MIDSIPEYTC